MPQFEVVVDTTQINLVTFVVEGIAERKFSLESFEMYVNSLPLPEGDSFEITISDDDTNHYMVMNNLQYQNFRRNCLNLLETLKDKVHLILTLKQNSQ
jgi:hypothetical protein